MAFPSAMAVEHYQKDYADTEQWLLLFFFLAQLDDALSNVNAIIYGERTKNRDEEARLVQLQHWLHTYYVDVVFPITVGWLTNTIHLLKSDLRHRAKQIDQEVTSLQKQLADRGFQLWALREGNKLHEYAEIARYVTHRSMDEQHQPLFDQHTLILLLKYSVYVLHPNIGGTESRQEMVRSFLAIRNIDVNNATRENLLRIIAHRLRQAYVAIAEQQKWQNVHKQTQQALANNSEWSTTSTRSINIIMMPHLDAYGLFKTNEERRKAQQDLREGRIVFIDEHHRLVPAGGDQFHFQEIPTFAFWKWKW